MSEQVPVRRTAAASPLPPPPPSPLATQSEPFSASAFDDFMGLPTSNSNERVASHSRSRTPQPQPQRQSTSSFGRKLRSFPWSRSSSSTGAAPPASGADKKPPRGSRQMTSARERIVSSAGPDAPRPGPSILKPATHPSSPTLGSPPPPLSPPLLPMGFPAPPPSASSSVSSAASLSTGTSFASTALFGPTSSSLSSDDAGWHSEATTVSLNSSPEIGSGGGRAFKPSSHDSLIQLRDSRRRAPKDASTSSPSPAARPFSVLSDIVERDNEDGGGRASMYDVLSLYSVIRSAGGGDVPVRRVSTPIPPAVALMLAAEPPATPPPRQKRWSTSSIEESPAPAATAAAGTATATQSQADQAAESPSPPPRRRRNSFDSPGAGVSGGSPLKQKRPSSSSSSSVRIPSMRFDGISMEAMFAEVEARVNRQLAAAAAAKQLATAGGGSGSSSSSSTEPENQRETTTMADALKKQARRKSRVKSLQEPLSFEISQPVFDNNHQHHHKAAPLSATRREFTIIEEQEDEEEEEEEEAAALPPRSAAYRTYSSASASRPDPLDIGAANSGGPVSRCWAPRSAPLQPSAPFFAAEVAASPREQGSVSVAAAKGAGSPPQQQQHLRGSIPELLVCPPSPPERPKRRAPPPPLRLGASPRAFPTMRRQQQPPSPASSSSPSPSPSFASAPAAPSLTHVVNGETKVTLVHEREKRYVRMSTRAQTKRRSDRSRTYSVPPVQPSQVGYSSSPRTPSTPTFEITPPPPEEEEESSAEVAAQIPETTAEMVALPVSEPSTPVRRCTVEGGAGDRSPVSPSPSSTSTSTVMTAATTTIASPYRPSSVLRTDYHPALSSLTVAYPTSDESSSSDCEESFQDMLIRLNRPHTPPPPPSSSSRLQVNRRTNAKTTTTTTTTTTPSTSSPSSSLTKSAMELHNTSHSRLSMLARELGETMLAKENVSPAAAVAEAVTPRGGQQQQQQPRRGKHRVPSTDSRRYSKLFAAGEVDLDQFEVENAGEPVLVSQAAVEPQSPTLMHLLKPIASEHGHADEEETWTARDSSHEAEDEDEDAVVGEANGASVPAADLEDPDLDLDVESELDRTLASLISDESAASTTTTSSSRGRRRGDSGPSSSSSSSSSLHGRADSDSSVASFDPAGAVIVAAKVVVPRSPVLGGGGHRSQLSDSSIGSTLTNDSADTDAEEGVVCLGERISCSYNVGVIGVAM